MCNNMLQSSRTVNPEMSLSLLLQQTICKYWRSVPLVNHKVFPFGDNANVALDAKRERERD
jgi:hypothetical protein